MKIKNWYQYLREFAEPVAADTDVNADMEQRNEDLEVIRDKVANIITASTALVTQNDVAAIDAAVKDQVDNNTNITDSFVTLALTYLKTIADKRKIELKLTQYQEQIPKLQAELKEKT